VLACWPSYRKILRTSRPLPTSRMPASSTQRAMPPPVVGSMPLIPPVSSPPGSSLLSAPLPNRRCQSCRRNRYCRKSRRHRHCRNRCRWERRNPHNSRGSRSPQGTRHTRPLLDKRTYVRLEYSHYPGVRLLLSLSPPMDGHQILIRKLGGRKGCYRCTGATRRWTPGPTPPVAPAVTQRIGSISTGRPGSVTATPVGGTPTMLTLRTLKQGRGKLGFCGTPAFPVPTSSRADPSRTMTTTAQT
jgi:hypothetical protein